MLWRNQVEDVLSKGCDTESGLKSVLENVERLLGILANCVLQEQPTLCRKKIENLVSKYVFPGIDYQWNHREDLKAEIANGRT